MLEVRDLHAHYGRAHILHGISFVLRGGEVVALMGRNGAGKSTTLKSVMGLVRPSAGRVLLEGKDITSRPPSVVSRLGLGYVPEERRVFPDLSVLENLEVGRQPPRGLLPAWTPSRLFQLFPRLAELRRRDAGRLSGGEQQMLTIARTLMGNPRALLLDEPSEGLAPIVVEQMAGALRELKRASLAILLSEQNLRFARAVAARALIIEKGQIRYAGSMHDLAADREVRTAYLTV
jgi:branched-chain amino acid transport system ATP-binding protein